MQFKITLIVSLIIASSSSYSSANYEETNKTTISDDEG